jgi:predicted transcriptional regulator
LRFVLELSLGFSLRASWRLAALAEGSDRALHYYASNAIEEFGFKE